MFLERSLMKGKIHRLIVESVEHEGAYDMSFYDVHSLVLIDMLFIY